MRRRLNKSKTTAERTRAGPQAKNDARGRQMPNQQSDKRQRMLACELTGEEDSQPIYLFFLLFTKSNRRVPYRLDPLMEQVRLTVSRCAYSIDSFLYGSCLCLFTVLWVSFLLFIDCILSCCSHTTVLKVYRFPPICLSRLQEEDPSCEVPKHGYAQLHLSFPPLALLHGLNPSFFLPSAFAFASLFG